MGFFKPVVRERSILMFCHRFRSISCPFPPLSEAKPVGVSATPVRMSVPLVSAQAVKQVSVPRLPRLSPAPLGFEDGKLGFDTIVILKTVK